VRKLTAAACAQDPKQPLKRVGTYSLSPTTAALSLWRCRSPGQGLAWSVL